MTDKEKPKQPLYYLVSHKVVEWLIRCIRAVFGEDYALLFGSALLSQMKAVYDELEDRPEPGPEAEPEEKKEAHTPFRITKSARKIREFLKGRNWIEADRNSHVGSGVMCSEFWHPENRTLRIFVPIENDQEISNIEREILTLHINETGISKSEAIIIQEETTITNGDVLRFLTKNGWIKDPFASFSSTSPAPDGAIWRLANYYGATGEEMLKAIVDCVQLQPGETEHEKDMKDETLENNPCWGMFCKAAGVKSQGSVYNYKGNASPIRDSCDPFSAIKDAIGMITQYWFDLGVETGEENGMGPQETLTLRDETDYPFSINPEGITEIPKEEENGPAPSPTAGAPAQGFVLTKSAGKVREFLLNRGWVAEADLGHRATYRHPQNETLRIEIPNSDNENISHDDYVFLLRHIRESGATPEEYAGINEEIAKERIPTNKEVKAWLNHKGFTQVSESDYEGGFESFDSLQIVPREVEDE